MTQRKTAADVDTGEVVTIRGVHPVADLFPMLDDEDLADLAASIADRGLEHPIVLDAKGQVLDGRNRLAACEQAGVKATATTYGGDDASGYALAVNVSRRSLTKGQKAMVTAKWCLETKQTVREVSAATGINVGRIGQARTVLDHAPDLVDAVISGATGLDAAYKTAGDRKRDAESAEKKMARLHAEAPDLAERVTQGELSLSEAYTLWQRRIEEERQGAIEANTAFAKAIQALHAVQIPEFRARTVTEWRDYPCNAPPTATSLVTVENLQKITEGLAALSELMITEMEE